MKHVVEVTQSALTQMLLNGFEAFVIKHGNNKRSGIEFYASVYGDIELNEKDDECRSIVQFVSVDTSATMKSGSVESNEAAEDLKEQLAEQLGYYRLGNMHSHPYLLAEMSLDEVRKRGCEFSDGDIECFKQQLENYEADDAYVLEFVLTIKQLEKQNTSKDGRIDDNVIEFSVGNCKCFLRAQVFTKDDSEGLIESPTQLVCDYLQEFTHLTAEFGRVKAKPNRKRVLEYKPV
ncbi:hypothetical protein ACED29_00225 [Shewanella sp. 5S214]|uniref:hypothetical protein n=1 Tax=Shewanella sp. 5S214 TaxID=3229999 RepID=UPI00352D0C10